LREKSAVSNIVAALLLIVITLGAASLVYSYSSHLVANDAANSGGTANGGGPNELTLDTLSFNFTSSGAPYPFVRVKITNNQSTATSAPFQQLLTIDPSLYTSFEAADLGNIRFYGNLSSGVFSNPIVSWFSFATSTPANQANSARFWLGIENGIAASSTVTVYMAFLPTTSEFDGIVAGEAPELSTNYGQYDNGANVFVQYGGKSWSSFTFQSGTWTTSNGYLEQTSSSASGGTTGGPAALIEGSQYSVTGTYVLETAFSYSGEQDARIGVIADATPIGAAGSGSADTEGYRFIGQQSSNGAGFISFLNDWVAWVSNGQYQGATSASYTMQVVDSGGTWSSNLFTGLSTAGSILASLVATTYTANNNQGQSSGYVGISAAYYTGSQVVSNPINVQWFRLRAYPPNGVMPSVSIGAAVPVTTSGADLYLRNVGGNIATISMVYVTNVSSDLFVLSYQVTNMSIQPDEVATVAVPFTPIYGTTYTFTIVTTSGSEFIFNAAARHTPKFSVQAT
jgi:hypothetical protein